MTAREWINTHFEDMLLADGFDEALIGWSYSPGRGNIAVYDAEQCIGALQAQGMSEEEACEHFHFNTEGSWVGEQTPVYFWRIPAEAERDE